MWVLKAVRQSRTDNTMAKRKKKNKRTNNDLQNITQKTKDQATRTPLKTRVNSCSSEGNAVPAPHVAPIVLFYYKPGDKSWMRKGPDYDNDKWNISVVICDTDTP